MKITKEDYPKIQETYRKFAYILKVIDSCTSVEQVRNAEDWGINVIEQDHSKYLHDLNPPFSIFSNELTYKVIFSERFSAVYNGIRKAAQKKRGELING